MVSEIYNKKNKNQTMKITNYFVLIQKIYFINQTNGTGLDKNDGTCNLKFCCASF